MGGCRWCGQGRHCGPLRQGVVLTRCLAGMGWWRRELEASGSSHRKHSYDFLCTCRALGVAHPLWWHCAYHIVDLICTWYVIIALFFAASSTLWYDIHSHTVLFLPKHLAASCIWPSMFTTRVYHAWFDLTKSHWHVCAIVSAGQYLTPRSGFMMSDLFPRKNLPDSPRAPSSVKKSWWASVSSTPASVARGHWRAGWVSRWKTSRHLGRKA